MKKIKGQVLITVFLLLLIVSVLAGALSAMWMSEIKSSQAQNAAQIAFYMANAGIERGKITVRNNISSSTGGWTGWYQINQYGKYKLMVANSSATANIKGTKYYVYTPVISAVGQALDATNNTLSERRMRVTLADLTDLYAAPDNIDEDDIMSVVEWQELP